MTNIDTKALRMKILDLAMSGKLVAQDPNDEPVEKLLERIKEERSELVKLKKIKPIQDSIIYKGDDNRYYEKIGKEVVDITENVPYNIPSSWKYIRQSTACWLDNGLISENGELPYLEAKVIRGTKTPSMIKQGVFIKKGQKVILVDGENSGEVMIIPFNGYMGSTFKILSVSRFINYNFLTYFFELNREKYKNNKTGSAIPHLNKDLFKNLLFPLPPINEQNIIVSKLNIIFQIINKIEANNDFVLQTTKQIKNKVLELAIKGKLIEQDKNDEPASVLLERIRAEKKVQLGKKYIESYIYKGDDNCYYEHIGGKYVNITKEIPFDLPNGWEWTKLKNIVFDIADIDHKMPPTVEEGIPYISPLNFLKDNQIDYIHAKKVSISDYINLSKKCKPTKGDIIFPRYGTIGVLRKVEVDIDFLVSYSCATIKPNQIWMSTELLYYFLNSPWIQVNQINKYINKTTQPNIGLNSIKEFLIPLPPLAEQKRIVDKINEIFAKL